MGGGTFDANSYRSFTASTVGKTTDQVYASRNMDKTLNPLNVKVRESRDSADNPNSTPVIVALDVTGSMGKLADVIARQGLGTLFNSILDRKPISDPHVMFMGIGDANCDEAPLQVSQFEANNCIVEQLTKLFLEGGGGGNDSESYHLPWYFAANHTAHDSYEKRAKRGYLFTVGDECAPPPLTKVQIKQFIGDTPQVDYTTEELLEQVRRFYDVYHIVIKEGDYARRNLDGVMSSWKTLLGQHVIPLADHTKLAETIVAAIEVAEGAKAADVASSWGGASSVIHDAIQHIPAGRSPKLLAAS